MNPRLRELEYRGRRVPAGTYEAIERYVDRRVPTGGFLRAVFANDLLGAVSRADSTSLGAIHAIACFVNNETPPGCRGSYEKVDAWLQGEDANIEDRIREQDEPEGS